MILSKRLATIYNMVDPCDTMADVGADHAHLCCALVANNICHKAYAIDIAKGPLNSGIEFINRNNLQDKVIPLLSNGLSQLSDDVNCVVIAGMGVNSVIDIIEQDINKFKKVEQIIVQVNKTPHLFRKYLSENNYTIIDEKYIFEQHDYQVIKFNMHYHLPYSAKQCYLGPILSNDINNNIDNYVHLYKVNENIIKQLTIKDDKYHEIEERLTWLKQILKKEN